MVLLLGNLYVKAFASVQIYSVIFFPWTSMSNELWTRTLYFMQDIGKMSCHLLFRKLIRHILRTILPIWVQNFSHWTKLQTISWKNVIHLPLPRMGSYIIFLLRKWDTNKLGFLSPLDREFQRYNLDILGLSEVRWWDSGEYSPSSYAMRFL